MEPAGGARDRRRRGEDQVNEPVPVNFHNPAGTIEAFEVRVSRMPD
jgi:hypothetical protein